MKRSLRLQALFFVLMAALLVGVAMEIHPKARAEVGTICSAGAPARFVPPSQPLTRPAASRGR